VVLQVEGAARDLRLTALVEDHPLRDVLTRLAEALHLTWREREGRQGREYMLFLSAADRAVVEREKAREWAEFRRIIRVLVDAAARDSPETGDPMERPARRLARSGTVRRTAAVLGALPDDLLDRALIDGHLLVPYDRMPPRLREAFASQRAESYARAAAMRDRVNSAPDARARFLPLPPPVSVEHLALEVRVLRRTGDGLRAQVLVGARGPAGRQGGFGLTLDPTACLSLEEQEMLRRNWGPREVDGKPALRFRPAASREPWEEAALRFARENKASFLAEAYDVTDEPADGTARALPEGAPPEQVLDRLCMAYDQTWNGETPLLLFRRRDWYFLRERQIPPTVERRWQRCGLEPGWFPVAELALMAHMHLSNEGQGNKLRRYAGEEAARTVLRSSEVLSLYGSLTEAQREAAHGEGFGVDRFDVSQRPRLEALLARLRPEARGLGQSFQSLRVREGDALKPALMRFTFRDGKDVTVSLPCRARPLRDPMVNLGVPPG
jgi:hypothetical protein